jgi:hypothetical protein
MRASVTPQLWDCGMLSAEVRGRSLDQRSRVPLKVGDVVRTSGHTVVVLQEPTEPDCALHIAKCRLGLNRWRFTGESPVRPLVVIALHIRSR